MKSGSDIPDEEAVADKIEQMLVEAWEKFCGYYDTKAPKYRESWRPKFNEEKDSHWICWNEYYLIFYIGRFFYDILSKKKEGKFSNIEMHFEKKVDRKNFEGYTFEGKLDELKKRLIRKGVLKKEAPKVDIIVADETSNGPFLLCAEVKHFHGQRLNGLPVKVINDDVEKLKALKDKDLGIAKRIVFMLFDDCYYCKRGRRTANAIQQRLDEVRNENGITVLHHTSEAKLENY